MRQVTSEQLTELLTDQKAPCVSIYQPTHRRYPENQENPIRYRNLLRELESTLREKYPLRETEKLMERFQAVARDNYFWSYPADGLAVLGSPDKFQTFELYRPVKELVVVADRFHIKPLLRELQSSDHFQVLCLNRQDVKLYEGNRDFLVPVELTHVPTSITEALGEELSEPHLTVASYGGAGKGSREMRHGHGGRKDEINVDLRRFFQVVDRAILEHHSRPSGLPLMLAALPEYHTMFHEVSRNPQLMAGGLQVDPDPLSPDELRFKAWQKIQPYYLERLSKLIDAYESARHRRLASDDLSQAAQSAAAGRVGTLLVEADRQIPGKVDFTTGQIELGELSHPEIGDIVDQLAETTLLTKGEVVVVPKERMPSRTGIAAIYRY